MWIESILVRRLVFGAVLAAGAVITAWYAIDGQWGWVLIVPVIFFGAAFFLVQQPLGRRDTDFGALRRKQEMDERRRQIELRAAEASFRLSISAFTAGLVGFLLLRPDEPLPLWFGVAYAVFLVHHGLAQFYYSRRL